LDHVARVIVFVGPTLTASEVEGALPAAEVEGPAACGDLYLACERRPAAIALIDGRFDHALSVWHKEILWALSQGIRVYGAASLGALRAAELADFGMIGVGRIFEAYQAGTLEDDDEVAVAHGPAQTGYRAASEALVNLRATMERAQEEESLTAAGARVLLQLAKATFYPERSYQALWSQAPDRGTAALDPDEVARFRRWVEAGGRVDQKRTDALELIGRLARDQLSGDLGRGGAADSPARFHFSYTGAWHSLLQDLKRRPAGTPGNDE
jgi:hypothetical protein